MKYVRLENAARSRIFFFFRDPAETQNSKGAGFMMHKRKVVQYTRDMEEIRTYDSIKEAQAEYNITHISGVCRRHRKTDGGFVWRYEDDLYPMNDEIVYSKRNNARRKPYSEKVHRL